MAITYKELTERGTEAILDLDNRGTDALVTDTERQAWNVDILEYAENNTENLVILTRLHTEDRAPNVVLRKGSNIYTLVRRGVKTNNGYDYIFNGPIVQNQNPMEYIVRYNHTNNNYTLSVRALVNSSDITKNGSLPPTSSLVKQTLETHTENENIHITNTERQAWNNKEEPADILEDLENDENNLTILRRLHTEDGAPNVVLKKGSNIYALARRGEKNNTSYEYVFTGPKYEDRDSLEYVVRYAHDEGAYTILESALVNSSDITKNGSLPPTSSLVKQALEAHTENGDVHITNAERTVWNSAANAGKTFYGVCSTVASVATKSVNVGSGFTLKSGVLITVLFQNAAASASGSARNLNVNSTGAYPIRYNGSSSLDADTIPSQMRALFVFDGSAWQLLNPVSKNKTIFILSFSTTFAGKTFTVAGPGLSGYSDIVPQNLEATVDMVEIGNSYTVTCDGYTRTFTVTGEGAYRGYFYLLEQATWEEIAAASTSGMASKYWQVGDEKNLSLGSFGEMTLQIYDFNHDDLADNTGKAGITFGLKNLLGTSYYMEYAGTNTGSFVGSCLYDQMLRSRVWNALPANLKSLIKPVKKKTSAGGASKELRTDSISLFLFSQVECLGNSTLAVPGEGYKYSIFTSNESRIKLMNNGAGPVTTWWTRSPAASNSTGYIYVSTAGGFGVDNAGSALGICFGFCI